MSKHLKLAILATVALFATEVLYAQDSLSTTKLNIISANTKDRIISENITDNFVRVDTTISDKAIKNIILSNLFSQDFSEEELHKIDKYQEYVGKIIDSIFIVKARPFDTETVKRKFIKFLYKAGNTLHHLSRSSIIEKGLLFEPGDRVRSQNIENSLALLRASDIFTSVDIYMMPSPTNSDMVNVYVVTQDNLSLRVGGTYRFSSDAEMFISDRNFMGTGNTFTLRYFINILEKDYARRAEVGYDMHNLAGKYIDLSTGVGAGDSSYLFRAKVEKFFVKDGDYAFGAGYSAIRSYDSYFSIPTKITTQHQNAHIWGGKSFTLVNFNNNLYFNVVSFYTRFTKRPKVSATLNPWFHNNLDFIATFGLYREKFYSGNLIYGYGHTETIPYGYKVEAVGGFRRGEFENLPYTGIKLKMGNLIKLGYLKAEVNFGTFLAPKRNTTERMVLDASINYFTNLITIAPGYHVRQFFKLRYTTGMDLLEGERTTIKFDNYYNLLSVSKDAQGSTRLKASAESVLFTPLHVYGFRFAFFGYVDIGTIGSKSNNPFKNEFYGIMGMGLRIKNEKLIVSTIQIRLGVAIRSNPNWRNSLYNIATEPKLIPESFRPDKPSYIPFD
ncbi:MAG: hypothetical protein RR363_01480 [Rikenellaceae bacterium]